MKKTAWSEGQRLALIAVRGDREGGDQGQLPPLHAEHGLGPALVQVPGALHGLDRVEAGLRAAVELPVRVLELQVPGDAHVVACWFRNAYSLCVCVVKACYIT